MTSFNVSRAPTVLFLCGPHCSGKTTILRQLLTDGEITERGSEIGKDLYYERNLETAEQDDEFEIEISELELRRDKAFLSCSGIVGIESWHPGNLAYAAVRNPEAVPDLLQRARRSPLLDNAYGIHFSVPHKMIAQRTRTFRDAAEWAADFYTKIDAHLDPLIEQIGLEHRTIRIDASRDFDSVYRDVATFVSRIRGTIS